MAKSIAPNAWKTRQLNEVALVDLTIGAAGEQAVSVTTVRLRFSFLVCIITLGILAFQFVNNLREVDAFKTVHWVWNYELGFVKRALPGAMAEWLLGQKINGPDIILYISSTIVLTVFLAYAAFAAIVVYARPTPRVAAIALSGALLQPALPNFAFDLGRFDAINFLLFLLACHAIVSGSRQLAVTAVAMCGSIAMLVHEAFLIMHLPLLLTVLTMRLATVDGLRGRSLVATTMMAGALPFVAFAAVWVLGSPSVPQTEWRAHWNARLPQSNIYTDGALELHYAGIIEDVRITLGHFSLMGLIMGITTVAAATGVAAAVWRHWIPDRTKWARPTCFAAALMPVFMFPLGLDFLRWSSAVTLNLLIAALCLSCLVRPPASYCPEPRNMSWLISHSGRNTFRVMLVALAYVYLLSPQSSGITTLRLPRPFNCLYGTHGTGIVDTVDCAATDLGVEQ